MTSTNARTLPEALHIQFALNPNIRAIYSKNKKITFTSPEELKHRVVNNIFEASFVVRNAPSFPYCDWVVMDAAYQNWSICSYERNVTTYLKRSQNTELTGASIDSGMINKEDEDLIPNPADLVDPRMVAPEQWTSAMVSRWINSNGPLTLRQISHFRRYGSGLSFEFLCHWESNGITWQKYSDLQRNPHYATYIRTHWDYKVERDRNWEDEDQCPKEDGFDIQQLPEIGNAYAIEDITIKAHQFIERLEKRRKKAKKLRTTSNQHQQSERKREHSGDMEICHAESSSSESSADENPSEEEEEDNEKPKVSAPFTFEEKLEWIDLFDVSSVEPVPRFKVKKFKDCVN